MGTPFLSEIRIFTFNYPPKGWAFCDGQILPINQNQALFSLLGTTYGGDGRTTFALPNLQGNAPLHMGTDPSGNAYTLGQQAGEAAHALTIAEMPAHAHTPTAANTAATVSAPSGNALAVPDPALGYAYGPPSQPVTMAPQAIATAGAGQGHNNMQPSLTLNFCIALQGIFPSRN